MDKFTHVFVHYALQESQCPSLRSTKQESPEEAKAQTKRVPADKIAGDRGKNKNTNKETWAMRVKAAC
jgi:hypothetical protein